MRARLLVAVLVIAGSVTACSTPDPYCDALAGWSTAVQNQRGHNPFPPELHRRAEELRPLAPAELMDDWQVVIEVTDKERFLRLTEEEYPDDEKQLRRIADDGKRMRAAEAAIAEHARGACRLETHRMFAEPTKAPTPAR